MNLLGGPIIRRAELTQVYLWIALDSMPQTLDASVKTANGTSVAKCEIVNGAPVQMGDNLFIVLLKMLPTTRSGQFPIKQKLFYDIYIDTQGLAAYTKDITYRNESLPSFFIPEKHQAILHGSCRKPHSGDDNLSYRDMMTAGDALINRTIDKLNERPSMLILTGDQIYADDVATSLLDEIIRTSRLLTGWDETMPAKPNTNRAVVPARIKLCGRDKIVNDKIGFTTGAGKNHLMSFGEYMAMYLITWGGIKISLADYSDIRNNMDTMRIRAGRNIKNSGTTVPVQKNADYKKEANRVQTFLKTASKARRLMANVPTYMILDDHEVTDDWNLKSEIYESFKDIALSRRLISNALAAYWACQGWGNNPDQFDANFIAAMQNHLSSKDDSKAANYETALARQYWGYEITGYPVVIVLDTRTQRRFEDGSMPQLINKQRLDMIEASINKYALQYQGEEDAQTVLIVSPTPALGFSEAEVIQLKLLKYADTYLDAESWFGNKTGMRNLENMLSKVFTEFCVILSGDVHYAFNRIRMLQHSDSGEDIKVLQMTSSALCNSPGKVGNVAFKTLASLNARFLHVFKKFNSHYLCAKGKDKDDFLTGHTNIALLELDAGIPVSYKLFIYNNDDQKAEKWNYDLQNLLDYTV